MSRYGGRDMRLAVRGDSSGLLDVHSLRLSLVWKRQIQAGIILLGCWEVILIHHYYQKPGRPPNPLVLLTVCMCILFVYSLYARARKILSAIFALLTSSLPYFQSIVLSDCPRLYCKFKILIKNH